MARQIKSHDSWDGLTRSYAQFRTLREKGEEEEGKLKKDQIKAASVYTNEFNPYASAKKKK